MGLQKELIDTQHQLDINQSIKRKLAPLRRTFETLQNDMEILLAQLYNLGQEELLIPQIEEMYETD